MSLQLLNGKVNCHVCFIANHVEVGAIYVYTFLPTDQQQPSSVPECSSSPKCSSSALIGVSAASLLVTVTLTIIIITQCLLMVRMRKSKDVVQSDETYTEVMTPTTMQSDVPVTPNEVYAFSKQANIIK